MKYIHEPNFKNSIFYKLSELPDKPKGLYIQGEDATLQGLKLVTIVGSRTCSLYAKQITEKLIRDLSYYPVCIVSGLAFGIDRIAHESALKYSVPTIAVPGSGLSDSVLYPASHRGLAQKIITSGGLLISEYLPDTKAARWTFPKRNRIMAGMSDLVIIIEAQKKSGTLITARLATEYNTEVAVIPQNITNIHAEGSNKLLQEGAFPILHYTDILFLLGIPEDNKKSTIEKNIYTEDQNKILKHLQEPKTKDELYKQSTLEYQDFITCLSILEIQGVIKEQNGKVHLL